MHFEEPLKRRKMSGTAAWDIAFVENGYGGRNEASKQDPQRATLNRDNRLRGKFILTGPFSRPTRLLIYDLISNYHHQNFSKICLKRAAHHRRRLEYSQLVSSKKNTVSSILTLNFQSLN